MILAAIITFSLVALAAVLAVVWVAFKVRAHRRIADQRIDVLAEETFERCLQLDRRSDAALEESKRLKRLGRVDHLFALAGAAERSGRIPPSAARRLERSLLQLHDDVRAENC